jgi:hypothetical protein
MVGASASGIGVGVSSRPARSTRVSGTSPNFLMKLFDA